MHLITLFTREIEHNQTQSTDTKNYFFITITTQNHWDCQGKIEYFDTDLHAYTRKRLPRCTREIEHNQTTIDRHKELLFTTITNTKSLRLPREKLNILIPTYMLTLGKRLPRCTREIEHNQTTIDRHKELLFHNNNKHKISEIAKGKSNILIPTYMLTLENDYQKALNYFVHKRNRTQPNHNRHTTLQILFHNNKHKINRTKTPHCNTYQTTLINTDLHQIYTRKRLPKCTKSLCSQEKSNTTTSQSTHILFHHNKKHFCTFGLIEKW